MMSALNEEAVEEGEVSSSSDDNNDADGQLDNGTAPEGTSSFPACGVKKHKKLKKSKDRDKQLKDPNRKHKKKRKDKNGQPLKKRSKKENKTNQLDGESSSSDDNEKPPKETSWSGVFAKPGPAIKPSKEKKYDHKSSSRSKSKESSSKDSKKDGQKSWYDLPDDALEDFGFEDLDAKSVRAASVAPVERKPLRPFYSPPREPPNRPRSSADTFYPRSPERPRSRSRHEDEFDYERRRSHSRTKTRSPSPPSPYRDSRHSRERDERRAEKQKDSKPKLVSTLRSPPRFNRWRKDGSPDSLLDTRQDFRDSRIFRPHPYIARPDPSYRKRIEDDRDFNYRRDRDFDRENRDRFQDRIRHDDRGRIEDRKDDREFKREEREPSVASVSSSVMTSASALTRKTSRSARSLSRARRIYTDEEKIDKAKLLGIARANLMKMVDAGTLPKGIPVERFKLSHLFELKKAKAIQEYTEFCRAMCAMEAAAYSDSDLSGSDDSDDDVKSVISQVTYGGRHPFEIKERKDIQIKVKDFTSLQSRNAGEIQNDLRESFPVSSGDRHRKIEWKDVEESCKFKKPEILPAKPHKPKGPPKEQPDDSLTYLKAKEAAEALKTPKAPEQPIIGPVIPGAPVTPEPETGASTLSSTEEVVFPEAPKIDIGSVMAMRLGAMRTLQNNPTNVVALNQMADAQQMVITISVTLHLLLVPSIRDDDS